MSWGTWTTGTNKMRLGIAFGITYYPSGGASPLSTDTWCRCLAQVWYEQNYNTYDGPSNTFSYWGQWGGETWNNPGVHIVSGTQARVLHRWNAAATGCNTNGTDDAYATADLNFYVDYALTRGTQTIGFGCSLTGISNISGTATHTDYLTIAARPYSTPASPSGFSAARSATTTATLGWTNNSTADAPYTDIHMKYATSSDGVTWSAWSAETALGYVSSYQHTNINPALSYKYAIHAAGNGGDSGFVESSAIVMVPSSPTSISVTPTTIGNPPTSVSKFTITFGRPADYSSGVKAWSGAKIERWSQSTNTWSLVQTLDASTNTWDDTNITADNKYQYRVFSYNNAGESAKVSSSTVYTIPAAPTGPVDTAKLATAKLDDQITLTWVNPSNIETGTEVYHSTNGGISYTKVHTTGENATSYVHDNLNTTVPHKYYVKNIAGTMSSTNLDSDDVTLISPPGAPTLTGQFVNKSFFDARDLTVSLGWTHNPTDGTSQTYYELQYDDNDQFTSPETTGKTAGSTNVKNYDPNTFTNNKQYWWRVRTWGQHADAGTWSASGTFKTNAKPKVTITQPTGGTYGSLVPIIQHEYLDDDDNGPSDQSAHRTLLLNAAKTVTLVDVTEENANTETTLAYSLTNGTEYVVQKYVKDSEELWSLVAEESFTVDNGTPPNVPDVPTGITITKVSDTEATVAWTAPASASEPIGTQGQDSNNGWSRVRIERYDSVSKAWAFIANESCRDGNGDYVDGSPYSDTTIVANREYKYRIRAEAQRTDLNGFVITSASDYVAETGTIVTTPAKPTGLMTKQVGDNIVLTWVRNVTYNGTQIEIRRTIDAEVPSWSTIATVDGDKTSYTDTTVVPGVTYQYGIRTKKVE